MSGNRTLDSDNEQLLQCWRQQSCGDCMRSEVACSWCPFTQSCVPNNYLIPALAPAYDENICPHWAERWEIRTHPLGCQVSTITSLTTLVTIASTLVFVLLVFLAVLGVKQLKRLHQKRPEWWKVWKYEWPSMSVTSRVWQRNPRVEPEEDPLLG